MILSRSNWETDRGITYGIRAITEEEENIIARAIEKGEFIDLPWAKRYKVHANNIKVYGKFNINNKTHRETITKMNLAKSCDGMNMPAGFSYKDASVDYHPKVGIKYTMCVRNMHHFAYCYTVIGRPERIVIYTYTKINYKNYYKAYSKR